MCGRYNITTDAQALIDVYQISGALIRELDLPTFNAAPTQTLPIVRNGQIEGAHWGLVPFWAKDRKSAFKMINARSETITEKRSYKNAIKKHRCLVPVTGWYEWRKENENKQPYVFETGAVTSLAGIYTYNKNLELLSYSIITTEANSLASEIHNRMPVILGEHQFEMWFDEQTDIEEIRSALVPYQGNDLSVRKVSKRVGNVINNNPDLLKEDKETED